MIDGRFCVRAAFIDIQRVTDNKNKRQSASIPSCNCSHYQKKRLNTERQLKERLASIEREATQNRRQRESEYAKPLRLLNLMDQNKY